MTTPTRRGRKHVPSIQDAPVSKRHLIADEEDSVEDPDARRLRRKPVTRRADEPELDLDHAQLSAERSFAIEARINQGCVDFRVSGKEDPITFEELAAPCAEQLPGVVLERRTKWLRYTFDLGAHAGQCLYSIPIACMPVPEPKPAARPPRRHPSDLAAHHPRG